jgi:DNA-binding NarL/FixJ family response regulator
MIKVLVVAEDPISRAGMAAMLEEQADLLISGQLSAADLSEDRIETFAPDVILVEWYPFSGEGQLDEILELAQDWPLLLIGSDSASVSRVREQGSSIIERSSSAPRIASALRAVAEGLLVLDRASFQLQRIDSRIQEASPTESLTERELEVLRLLADGLTNRGIALELGISVNTVKFHVNAILGKFAAQSRTEAVVRAMQAGILHI